MKDKDFTIDQLVTSLPDEVEVIGDAGYTVSGVARPDKATDKDIIFISKDRKDKIDIVRSTLAKVIIITEEARTYAMPDKIFILTEDPKLVFSVLVNKFFTAVQEPGIHPSAVIDRKATIGRDVYIGPNVVIGENVSIGDFSIIYGNVFIYKNTTIGKYVKIGANCSIAAEGFGYNKDKNGVPIQFPHLGGVIIEDYVEIGCNTCIDRGSLGDTHLKQHVKVDNLVHIAHNVVIGRNSYIIANAMIGGSTVIGENSWVAPSSALRDAITIGNNSVVGMGAVIVKSIDDNETWTGNPGKLLEDFKKQQQVLKKIVESAKE